MSYQWDDAGPWGPLVRLLPPEALADWSWVGEAVARDTGALVQCYRHAWSRRELALDLNGRVYERDVDGGLRLFGDGGPVVLLAALAVVYAGVEVPAPRRINLPEAAPTSPSALGDIAGALARVEAELWRRSTASDGITTGARQEQGGSTRTAAQ